MQSFTVACIQDCAEEDIGLNLERASHWTAAARAAGAEFICLPEYFGCLAPSDGEMLARAAPESEHPLIIWGRATASAHGVWLLLGSIAALQPGGRVRNRSVLLSPAGELVARYDKLHLFDVELPSGERYQESRCVEPGEAAVVAELPWGRLGMTICYDLRFAYLYRALAQAGAAFITVPAAFTRTTGQAHWESLLRARAIETGSFIIAPGQCGVRHWGRATWGHSMVVDPWGTVVASLADEPGYLMAHIEPERVDQARRMIPALLHDRDLPAIQLPSA